MQGYVKQEPFLSINPIVGMEYNVWSGVFLKGHLGYAFIQPEKPYEITPISGSKQDLENMGELLFSGGLLFAVGMGWKF